MLVAYGDLEFHLSIHRNPFCWRECQIIAVPFETFGSIEILLIIEIYHDAVLVDSFADILDIEDEILVQTYPFLGIFRIDEVDARRDDVRFAFGYLHEIQCEGLIERIGLRSSSCDGSRSECDDLHSCIIALEDDLEGFLLFLEVGEKKVCAFQDDLIIFYLGTQFAYSIRRKDAEDLDGVRVIIQYELESRDLLALRRKEDICRIGASCMELVGRLKSYVRIQRLQGDFGSERSSRQTEESDDSPLEYGFCFRHQLR